MNIGEFRKVNGRLIGSIATRTIDLPKMGLRAVESDNPRAPKFEVIDHQGALPTLPSFSVNMYVTRGPRRRLAEPLAARLRAAYATPELIAAE